MMALVSKLVEEITQKLLILESLPEVISSEISRLDKEQEDMLHLIELTKANASEGYKLYQKMHNIRNDRRKYKEMQEEIFKVSSVLGQHKTLRQSLEKTANNINKLNEAQGKREYGARSININDSVAKLKSVNKTDIKFKTNPRVDRMNELFKQIESKK